MPTPTLDTKIQCSPVAEALDHLTEANILLKQLQGTVRTAAKLASTETALSPDPEDIIGLLDLFNDTMGKIDREHQQAMELLEPTGSCRDSETVSVRN